ncbi:MAG: transcriptional repressor [Phycisphaerales bacterium]|nr:transcriptional repressor [Planctomycetota bacterium]
MERNTRQRSAIRTAIDEAHGPVSAREVLELAQRRVKGMGMATVYRTIKSLVADREIVEVAMPGEPPRYETAGKAHHHHFYCRSCGKMYEVEQCPGDLSWLAPKGFKLESHDLLLLGLCDKCLSGKKVAKGTRAVRPPTRPRAHPHTDEHGHPPHAAHPPHGHKH